MPGLPNDPVGAGADMSQWQNWLMSMLQGGGAPTGGPPYPPNVVAAVNAGGTAPVFGPQVGQSVSGATNIDTSVVPPMTRPQPVPTGAPPQPIYNPLAGGSANTGRPAGYGPPPQPTYNPLAGGSANTGAPPGSASAAPAAAVPGSPAARGINLGYYGPMTGNARQAQPMTYANPNDPRIFRGPLATPPAAPAAQTIPPTATASVPPAPITARPDLAQRVPQNQWPTPPPRPTGWPFNQ